MLQVIFAFCNILQSKKHRQRSVVVFFPFSFSIVTQHSHSPLCIYPNKEILCKFFMNLHPKFRYLHKKIMVFVCHFLVTRSYQKAVYLISELSSLNCKYLVKARQTNCLEHMMFSHILPPKCLMLQLEACLHIQPQQTSWPHLSSE